MNFAHAYNYSIATILIVICLVLPSANFASTATLEAGLPSVQLDCGTMTTEPCGTCPCSDGQGSDCCDTTSCTCQCHAPVSQYLQLAYVPVVATQGFREPSWSLPEVYSHIFVPPQNPA
jgi:hypothetical protein